MTTIAPLKPERFDSVVEEYVDFRVRYDPRLIADVARHTGVTSESTALDLGCGPGFIAHEMASHAGEVIGADPSPSMVAAARAGAPANTRFVEGSSFDLSFAPAGLQLVTMGRSFHWMDRSETLARLDTLMAPTGAIAILGDTVIDGPSSRWWTVANEVTKSFAVGDAYDAHRRSDAWQPHEEVLLGSAFSDLTYLAVYRHESWTYASFLGNTLSRSGTTPEKLGARRAELEAAVIEALRPFGPEPWTTLNRHYALVARRPS